MCNYDIVVSFSNSSEAEDFCRIFISANDKKPVVLEDTRVFKYGMFNSEWETYLRFKDNDKVSRTADDCPQVGGYHFFESGPENWRFRRNFAKAMRLDPSKFFYRTDEDPKVLWVVYKIPDSVWSSFVSSGKGRKYTD